MDSRPTPSSPLDEQDSSMDLFDEFFDMTLFEEHQKHKSPSDGPSSSSSGQSTHADEGTYTPPASCLEALDYLYRGLSTTDTDLAPAGDVSLGFELETAYDRQYTPLSPNMRSASPPRPATSIAAEPETDSRCQSHSDIVSRDAGEKAVIFSPPPSPSSFTTDSDFVDENQDEFGKESNPGGSSSSGVIDGRSRADRRPRLGKQVVGGPSRARGKEIKSADQVPAAARKRTARLGAQRTTANATQEIDPATIAGPSTIPHVASRRRPRHKSFPALVEPYKARTQTRRAKIFRCPHADCTQSCGSKGDLDRHLQVQKHQRPSYPCLACENIYTRTDALKRHLTSKPQCKKLHASRLRCEDVDMGSQ